jgi:hypothetical protein
VTDPTPPAVPRTPPAEIDRLCDLRRRYGADVLERAALALYLGAESPAATRLLWGLAAVYADLCLQLDRLIERRAHA